MEKSPEAFRTITEVAEILDTPAHVLRFWESRFTQVRPVKRAGGRRYYRPTDVALLAGIRFLLHDQGMTIRGVQKILREQGVKHVCSLASQGLALEAQAEWAAQAQPSAVIAPLAMPVAATTTASVIAWPAAEARVEPQEEEDPFLPFDADEIEAEDLDVVEPLESLPTISTPQNERAAVYSVGLTGLSPQEAARGLMAQMTVGPSESDIATPNLEDQSQEIEGSENNFAIFADSFEVEASSMAEFDASQGEDSNLFAADSAQNSALQGFDAEYLALVVEETAMNVLENAAEHDFYARIDARRLAARIRTISPYNVDQNGLGEVAQKLRQLRNSLLSQVKFRG